MVTQWNNVLFLCAVITFLPAQTHFIARIVLSNPATGQHLEEWMNVPTMAPSTGRYIEERIINPAQQRSDLINRAKKLVKHTILIVQDDKSEAQHLIHTGSSMPLHLISDTPDDTLMGIVRNVAKDLIVDSIREKLNECTLSSPCSPLDYSYAYALMEKIFAINIGLDMEGIPLKDFLKNFGAVLAPSSDKKVLASESVPRHHFIFAADIQTCLILNTLLQTLGWEIVDIKVPTTLSEQQQSDFEKFITDVKSGSLPDIKSVYSHAVDVDKIRIPSEMKWNPALNLEKSKRKDFIESLLSIIKIYTDLPQLIQLTSLYANRAKAKNAAMSFLGYLVKIATELPTLDQSLVEVRKGIAEKYQAVMIEGKLPAGFENEEATAKWENLTQRLIKELDIPLEATPTTTATLSHGIFFEFIDKMVRDYKGLPELVKATSLIEGRAKAKNAVTKFLTFLGSLSRHTSITVLKQDINRRYNLAVREGDLPGGLESQEAQNQWEALTKDLVMLEIQTPFLDGLKKVIGSYEGLPGRVQSTREFSGTAGWERRAQAKKAAENFLKASKELVADASRAENVDINALKQTIAEQYDAAVAAGGLPGNLEVGPEGSHDYLSSQNALHHWNELTKKLKQEFGIPI